MIPYQSEDPSPTLPTYRGKEEKEKIVEDKKRREQLGQKKALDLLLKPSNPTPSNTGQQDRSREILRENKGPAVLRGSAARRRISIPKCDQSTACT